MCFACYTAYKSWELIESQLTETGMHSLFETVEMPLVFTLFDMEQAGVLVRPDELKVYSRELAVKIEQIEKEIYAEAGEEFNINSPKQLGVILFDKLQMPYGKKTKTGYSTAADVLEKLAPDYPIVSKILEYRQLTKLKSTYADGLAVYIREDGRIHRADQQYGAEPAEYPHPYGDRKTYPKGFCACGGLCVCGRGLFPDRAACAGTHVAG